MLTVHRPCNYCGNIYEVNICLIARNKNIFCSRKCAGKGRTKVTDKTFWDKVDVKGPNDCWIYTGRKDNDGYGQLVYNGRTCNAHRISYILKNGEIHKGKVIMHTCDNPPCCNPNHLQLGTQKQNIADMIKKGRYRNGGRGSAHILSVLTYKQRQEILNKFNGKRGQRTALAIEYGVCRQTISNLLVSKFL